MARRLFIPTMFTFVMGFLFFGIFSVCVVPSCSSQVDTLPPQIEDISPDNGATGIPIDTNICFRLKDSHSGVDISSIVMKVKDKLVIPHISGDSRETILEYKPRQTFFYAETVITYVRVQDLAPVPNCIEYTFSFTIEQDRDKPYIAELSPSDESTGVSFNTNISFHLLDDGAGVDRSSIVMEINDTAVNPLISGNKHDYIVEYHPGEGFNYSETVNVSVITLDLAVIPNRMEHTFTFSIEGWNHYNSDNIRLNMIYYGEHDSEIDSLITSVAPIYLIGNPAHGVWGEIYGYDTSWLLQDVARFRQAGIKVIGYLTSGYEGTGSSGDMELKWYTLEMNKNLITNMAEKDLVDGIFIDECSSYPNATAKQYLKELAELAHSYGLIVWGNVGHGDFDEWFFTDGGFDMLNTSENWQGQTLTQVQNKWRHYISVSGFYSGQDTANVYHLIEDAWDKGLAYAYLTCYSYAELPSWIDQLAELIRNHT